ncbi:hypothetical protein ACIPW9_37055 [Streptomyces sp. NPDC090052]|uniref:hypothetical protein n=1 Tax=Streptomyces sp. NPDC090052 TaxID=3365931 RepID=UPI003801803A
MLLADPCDAVAGPSQDLCKGGGSGGGSKLPESVDPLSGFAHSVAKAANWTATQLGHLVANRDSVDITNSGFLKQYAVVFAASTILVLVLWLLAVAKRAIRGVPLTTAISEAISLLWLAVAATAFTPLILYTVIGAVSAVTDVLVSATGGTPGGLFATLGSNLTGDKIGGGPIILIVASLLTILLCGALYLLLLMRALALYVGALLGVVVYGGLVDKDLWGHVRKWAGGMVALILIEPVVVIILGLAAVLESSGEHGPVITGLGVTVIALGAAVTLVSKFPAFGDSIQVARAVARTSGTAARAVTGGASATTGVMRGIQAHSNRGGSGGGDGGRANSGAQKSQNSVAGGMSAHSQRTPKPKKDDGGKK